MRSLPLCADRDRGRRRKFIVRNDEVQRCRPLPDSSRRVVHRTVARAEIATVGTSVLALADAERHTTQVRADAQCDQPVLLSWLGALSQRLLVAEIGERN